MLDNNEIQKPTLDLGSKRKGQLDESVLTSLGAELGYALGQLLAGAQPHMNISGTAGEIGALAAALGVEKQHLQNIMRHGPNSPQARASLSQVERVGSRFHDVTGIPWPFTS